MNRWPNNVGVQERVGRHVDLPPKRQRTVGALQPHVRLSPELPATVIEPASARREAVLQLEKRLGSAPEILHARQSPLRRHFTSQCGHTGETATASRMIIVFDSCIDDAV